MRKTFVELFKQLALKNKDSVLITPDMGFSLFEELEVLFKDTQFFNVGVAEQNAIGIAAGLALSGKTVFVYSIVPFITFRCLEQIRIDVCYQNLPIIIVGSGGGLCYGALGPTHHSIEDIGIMRSLPNMEIYCPADQLEAKKCILRSYALKKPSYIRLGRGNEQKLHSDAEDIDLLNGCFLKNGDEALIITSGIIAKNCLEAATYLKEKFNVDCAVLTFPYINAITKNKVKELILRWDKLIVVEEHSYENGIGQLIGYQIANLMSESDISQKNIRFKHLGIAHNFVNVVGNHDYLKKRLGLDTEGLISQLIGFINK
ncbi:MAG: transketolase C-terminal domain-containing protein [Candidatus Anstonellales archaeon]